MRVNYRMSLPVVVGRRILLLQRNSGPPSAKRLRTRIVPTGHPQRSTSCRTCYPLGDFGERAVVMSESEPDVNIYRWSQARHRAFGIAVRRNYRCRRGFGCIIVAWYT